MSGARTIPIRCPGGRTVWLAPSDLALYRGATLGLLRRYFQLSVEIGRLPSLLGRECFRARLSSYQAQSFEDVVIFVHDLERCVERLDEFSQQLLARVVFQEHSREEAAALLGCTRKTVFTLLADALDRLSTQLLRRCLLPLLPLHAARARPREKSCQEGKNAEISATASKHRK
ncbi:MAG TPA: sigma factor-like helix-turn-helix DNA-binding protein [Terriglobales bacterium]|nr:sigma factor-like helix-turn-helix DNA-binding protein [Terriglobales bacterium]